MFGNKANEPMTQNDSPQTTTPPRNRSNDMQKNSITAYLGPDVRIEGELHFESSVLIEGVFKGKVVSEHGQLTIGEKARVEGDLTGGQITIRGHVQGSVTATERVHLADRGELIGDLTTPSLQMDESVTFDGNCKMNGGKRNKQDEKVEARSRSEEIVDAIQKVS